MRHRHPSLSPSYCDASARIPFVPKAPFNPFRSGHKPRLFAWQVNARLRSQPEMLGEIGQLVNAHQLAHRIKVSVAGLDNGAMEVHYAMATMMHPRPVMVGVAVKRGIAWTIHRVIRVNRSGFKPGDRRNDFKN